MATVVVMVMAVAADAHTNATNVHADNGCVGSTGACSQQRERKDRGNEGFHGSTFGRELRLLAAPAG